MTRTRDREMNRKSDALAIAVSRHPDFYVNIGNVFNKASRQ